jgi:hypothetical protein
MKRLTAAPTSSNGHFVTIVTMDLGRRKISAAIDVVMPALGQNAKNST